MASLAVFQLKMPERSKLQVADGGGHPSALRWWRVFNAGPDPVFLTDSSEPEVSQIGSEPLLVGQLRDVFAADLWVCLVEGSDEAIGRYELVEKAAADQGQQERRLRPAEPLERALT